MRYTRIILFSIFIYSLITSCEEKKENCQANTSNEITEHAEIDDTVEINRDPIIGDVTINGKIYSYEYVFTPSDSLPIITSSLGQKYYDNICKLVVKQGDKVIQTKKFTKESFKQFVPKEHYDKVMLFGGNVNIDMVSQRDKLYFVACITEPDGEDVKTEIGISITVEGKVSISEFVELPMR